MHKYNFAVLLLILSTLPMGCAAGFRAGGPQAGIGAGASVGPDQPANPYYAPASPPAR